METCISTLQLANCICMCMQEHYKCYGRVMYVCTCLHWRLTVSILCSCTCLDSTLAESLVWSGLGSSLAQPVWDQPSPEPNPEPALASDTLLQASTTSVGVAPSLQDGSPYPMLWGVGVLD